MKKLVVFSVAVCLAFAACMTAPAPRTVVNAFPIDQPFDPVWQAVIETFADMNLPILNMEKASGLITTDWIRFPYEGREDGYCDCGGLGANAEVDRSGCFNVFVKRSSDSSCDIKINVRFQRIVKNMLVDDGSRPINECVSTGKLEAEMFGRISDRLK